MNTQPSTKNKKHPPALARRMVRVWIAKDEAPCINGERATCFFFGKKPHIVSGYWTQCKRTAFRSVGRWPVDGRFGLRNGQIVAATINPNAPGEPRLSPEQH